MPKRCQITSTMPVGINSQLQELKKIDILQITGKKENQNITSHF